MTKQSLETAAPSVRSDRYGLSFLNVVIRNPGVFNTFNPGYRIGVRYDIKESLRIYEINEAIS